MSQEVAIVKYNAGNVASVMFALDRIGAKYYLTDSHSELLSAEKVIFPGVGEASTAMKYLKEKGLDKIIPQLKQPVLATCIGMQLLCKHSQEGNVDCLGVFDTNIVRFESKTVKIPHVGWNTIYDLKPHPLLEGINENDYVYFVHSFCAPISEYTIASCHYIRDFSAIMQKDNFMAAQFHAEISGDIGQRLLQNFITI